MLDAAVRTADQRVLEAPEAAGEVAKFCGYLPLALSVVAAILVSEPEQPISEVAAALRSSNTRLSELSYDRGSLCTQRSRCPTPAWSTTTPGCSAYCR